MEIKGDLDLERVEPERAAFVYDTLSSADMDAACIGGHGQRGVGVEEPGQREVCPPRQQVVKRGVEPCDHVVERSPFAALQGPDVCLFGQVVEHCRTCRFSETSSVISTWEREGEFNGQRPTGNPAQAAHSGSRCGVG